MAHGAKADIAGGTCFFFSERNTPEGQAKLIATGTGENARFGEPN